MPRNVGVMLFLALAVCGCGGGAPEGADLGADAQVDSAAPPDDAGPDAGDAGEAVDDAGADAGEEACGGTTCDADEHCCATCPGESDVCVSDVYDGCPIADEFDCAPFDCAPAMDVSDAAVGDCDAILGYWWNGVDCRSLSGCSCSGDVCGDLFANDEDCEAAHSACSLCGTVWHVLCDEGEYCRFRGAFDPCDPVTDQHGTCVPIPTSCDAVSEPVCACDGVTYDNPCLVRAAQQTLEHRGACAP
ncbi:MAG: hypothetical protein IPN77_01025 [Sandaracinaceae bacterium]|nr:hypothetical protein [Sandaracinaceae bacterium]MBP7680411.1 hypothetical protein [Deltaproteobacteria bacterium]